MILALFCLGASIFCGVMTARAYTTRGRVKQPNYGEVWSVRLHRQMTITYISFGVWLVLLALLKVNNPEYLSWTFWAVLSALAGPLVAVALGYKLKVNWERYEATWRPVHYDYGVDKDMFLHDPRR